MTHVCCLTTTKPETITIAMATIIAQNPLGSMASMDGFPSIFVNKFMRPLVYKVKAKFVLKRLKNILASFVLVIPWRERQIGNCENLWQRKNNIALPIPIGENVN
jgi:hypothetical protein